MAELSTSTDDDFSPADQAAFEAMRAGSPPPEAPPEPEAQPEPAPEAQEPEAAQEQPQEPDEGEEGEGEGEGEAEGNKGQYVRREALRQERERRKQHQREVAQLREERAALNERLRIFAEASQRAQAPQAPQAAPAEEQVPNPEEDIFGYAKYLEKQVNELRNGFQESRQQAAAREQGEQVLNSYKADAARFAQAEPTFPDAYNHLYRSRAAELQHAGMTDPQQIMRAIAADEFQIAQQALRDGVSPAQRIYEIAKARGFAPKAPEPAADPAAAAKPVGETAAQKAERAAAGQRGPGRSLSSVGGKPAGSMPTVEELANMSEDEFNRFAKTNPGAVTALMGG